MTYAKKGTHFLFYFKSFAWPAESAFGGDQRKGFTEFNLELMIE